MDIDQFLDQEIQAQQKEDVEKEVEHIEVPKEEKDDVKYYFGLWKKVSEAKFKWDPDLYSELDKATAKVKENLDASLLTVEREKTAIKRLIGGALRELKHDNYEAATKLYSEISDMRNKFPDFLLEEKKEINKEIFQLYRKLHDQIDSKFINDFKESIEKINNFVKDAFSHLHFDIDKAKNFYEKGLEIYKDLPNGFMSQKLELGTQLLTLYKDLSVQTQIENLQKQLSRGAGYKYTSGDERLKRLSQIIKKRHIESALTIPGKKSETLLPRLIERKLDRAKVNLQKGLYREAKKNIEAIIKVDPDNIEANELLNKLPAEY